VRAEEGGDVGVSRWSCADFPRAEETYYSVKRDLLQCQKRPTTVSKETYYSVKRDLLQCQKRPTTPWARSLVETNLRQESKATGKHIQTYVHTYIYTHTTHHIQTYVHTYIHTHRDRRAYTYIHTIIQIHTQRAI
jgi:hypothetical protein